MRTKSLSFILTAPAQKVYTKNVIPDVSAWKEKNIAFDNAMSFSNMYYYKSNCIEVSANASTIEERNQSIQIPISNSSVDIDHFTKEFNFLQKNKSNN